jgi:hypothetical protein
VKTLTLPAFLAILLATSTSLAAESAAGGDDPDKASTSESQAGMKTVKHADTGDDAPEKPKKDATPKEPDKEEGEDATFGHGFQFGLRAGVQFGYRIMFRYDHSPLCEQFDKTKSPNDQKKICGFGASPGTEVAVSFAPLDSVEAYLFGRFGFSGEARTNTDALQMFGVGARIYTMSDSRFKIFVEPALAYETEGGGGNLLWDGGVHPSYKKDLVFHVGVGPQFDFAKAFGIFVNGAVDVGVLRSLGTTLLVNIGAQLRFP